MISLSSRSHINICETRVYFYVECIPVVLACVRACVCVTWCDDELRVILLSEKCMEGDEGGRHLRN
jgi:hypothetical protein